MEEDAPVCGICGRAKLPGTWTVGRRVTRFWACGALAGEHDEILAHQVDADLPGAEAWRDRDEIEWDRDETENEMDWDDI